MTMRRRITIATFILTLLGNGLGFAQDGAGRSVAYFRSPAFNAPRLEGWEDQSDESAAQFHLAEAGATIRTAIVPLNDIMAAVGAELSDAFDIDAGQPIYQDKVNLADGTWTVLIFEPEAGVSASVMARLVGGATVVISFVESDPAARIVMLTLERADDSQADASPEVALAIQALAGTLPSFLAQAENVNLPSGQWIVYTGEDLQAMGMVFGNDSYLALAESAGESLPALADAYNRALLGFFITPDNSGYLALGLAAAFFILATWIGSLFWRERGLRKELALLRELAGADA